MCVCGMALAHVVQRVRVSTTMALFPSTLRQLYANHSAHIALRERPAQALSALFFDSFGARFSSSASGAANTQCWACGVHISKSKPSASASASEQAQEELLKRKCECDRDLPIHPRAYVGDASASSQKTSLNGEDFFAVLGLDKTPKRYDAATPAAINDAHRKLQLRLHPDRFPKSSELTDDEHAERIDHAMALSAYASLAAATLRDPLAKARYVLATSGCPVDTEEGARDASSNHDDAMEWLETVMEVNEEVEEAAGDAQALLEAHTRARDVYDDCLDKFKAAVDASQWDGHGPTSSESRALCLRGAHWIVRAAYMRTAMDLASTDDAFPAI